MDFDHKKAGSIFFLPKILTGLYPMRFVKQDNTFKTCVDSWGLQRIKGDTGDMALEFWAFSSGFLAGLLGWEFEIDVLSISLY